MRKAVFTLLYPGKDALKTSGEMATKVLEYYMN